MRRSLLAGFGVVAVLLFAACSPDQASHKPLIPTEPSFAQSQQCSGQLASTISKQLKLLFTGAALADMQDRFNGIQSVCPNDPAFDRMMDYIDAMIGYRDVNKADLLVEHLGAITLYVTNSKLVRSASVMGADGGADVLVVTPTAGDEIVTFDQGARLAFGGGTEAILQKTPLIKEPFGKRLFTFEPKSSTECGNVTSLRSSSRGKGAPCFDIQDYFKAIPGFPAGALEYTPAATLSFCMLPPGGENAGILHDKSGYGEVLPFDPFNYNCDLFHASTNGWLERNGGPLGRVLARAYGYLAPRPLFADDVGESGSIGSFSLVGGILNDIFEDNFDDASSFNPNPANDSPDLGDGTWIFSASSPGFIRIQDALGEMSGGVLVLSQAQGACNNCPVFRLLGTRQNAGENETIGSYDVKWTSLQNKPNVKEAPFMLFSDTPNNNNTNGKEIARLSYVSVSNQNRLLFKVLTDTGLATFDVGAWIQNEADEFRISLNLNTLSASTSQRISLFVNDVLKVDNVKAVRATAFKHLGYMLTGIDAGIIASDDWFVTRLQDNPPQ